MLTLEAIIDKLAANQARLGIELHPPAPEAELQRFEQALGRPLPPDIAAFYRYCNGFETNDDLFRGPPVADIMQISGTTLAAGRFVVAEYLICSDLWEVVLGPAGRRYCIVNDDCETEVTLTTSLHHFLSRYLDGKNVYDLYVWREETTPKLP